MAKIISAHAYCNNEVAFIAWAVDGPIPGAYGFQVTRIFLDDGEDHKKGDRRILPAWVAFKGQSNPQWKEQDTSVWPVQGLFWRDLTLRRKRDTLRIRDSGFRAQYEIRAVGPEKAGLPPVPVVLPKTYDGERIPLSYYSAPKLSNPIAVTSNFGGVSASFTNGILSSQWLARQIDAALDAKKRDGHKMSRKDALIELINTPGNKVREYLVGDVLGFLRSPLDQAMKEDGSVLMALYELQDPELVKLISKAKRRVRIILSNSSKGALHGDGAADEPNEEDDDGKGKVWDAGNSAARATLEDSGVDIQNRMFNNGHIGHNKFVVFVDKEGAARSVLTGSTNWTATGLCGQSNNALLIDDAGVARVYQRAWQNLLKDTGKMEQPDPLTDSTRNVQDKELRNSNMNPARCKVKPSPTGVTIWQSPNTERKTKPNPPPKGPIPDEIIPPDLAEAFSLLEKAKDAIFFLVFMPSRQGRGSVVERAIAMGIANPSLLVVGAVSDPSVLPNYTPSKRVPKGQPKPPKVAQPHFYEPKTGLTSVVQADALYKGDLVGDFEPELKSAGHAIIHDKIVVIDPLSDDCVVITGSHNLGLKASYENDENLLIIRGNRKLAEAYAVHALDVYDHYKWRARRAQDLSKGVELDKGTGRLKLSDDWLALSQQGRVGRHASYFATPRPTGQT